MSSPYPLFEHSPDNGLRYLFTSRGTTDIIKIVDYSFVDFKSDAIKADAIYNFGFGDLDLTTGQIEDEIKSENGDVRKVFNTALSTIPSFFEKFPKKAIMVTGSDSKDDFHERCYPSCKKKCQMPENCKNKHQRINVYMMYLNKNFNELNKTYTFFGGTEEAIELYEPERKYKSVFVIKK